MSERFEVYARRKHEEPLTHLGTVSIAEGASLAGAVRGEHGDDWLELVAFPESAIGWAIGRPEETAAPGGPE